MALEGFEPQTLRGAHFKVSNLHHQTNPPHVGMTSKFTSLLTNATPLEILLMSINHFLSLGINQYIQHQLKTINRAAFEFDTCDHKEWYLAQRITQNTSA